MSTPEGTHAAPRSEWLSIPNLISTARIAATPVFIWLIVGGLRIAALVMLAAMGLSDFLDGKIARVTKRVTRLGVVLDPASDRIVVSAAIVSLMITRTLPVWLGIVVLAREVLLVLAYLAIAGKGFGRPNVSLTGKAATATLFIGLPLMMLTRTPGLAVFGVGAVLYYVAGVGYAREALRWARTKER